MKKLLVLAAVGEAATGFVLLVLPAWVGRLLLGAELTGVAVSVAGVLGIALIALAVACWPGRTALCGMLSYSTAVTLFLGSVGIRGHWVGPLLWPAVIAHLILTGLLALSWMAKRKNDKEQRRNP